MPLGGLSRRPIPRRSYRPTTLSSFLYGDFTDRSVRDLHPYVFADAHAKLNVRGDGHIIELPAVGKYVAPILYTVPLQLLAYHVAVLKGTDIDQPRNLAKSVTVE